MPKLKAILGLLFLAVGLYLAAQCMLVARLLYEHSQSPPPPPPPTAHNTSNAFDPDRHWLVFFHMQKTSGTHFDLELLERLLVFDRRAGLWRRACLARTNKTVVRRALDGRRVVRYTRDYQCHRANDGTPTNDNNTWLISGVHASGFGWQCGLHPDLTDMRQCLRRRFAPSNFDALFFYVSMLREPVARYVSEMRHTRRTGSLWIFESEPLSRGQKCARSFYAACVAADSAATQHWRNVSDEAFMACPTSLAANRQTRMLAAYDDDDDDDDGKTVDPNNDGEIKSGRFDACHYLANHRNKSFGRELVARAKAGLRSLNFFGIAEHQRLSRRLFVRTFDGFLAFDEDGGRRRGAVVAQRRGLGERLLHHMDRRTVARIEAINRLDVELYRYALELFFQRLKFYNITDDQADS